MEVEAEAGAQALSESDVPSAAAPLNPMIDEATDPISEFEAALQEDASDVLDVSEVVLPSPEPPTPAHARLGAEGVLRLRARHAEILARISEKISDPARRDELRAQADRLNPDMWVTSDEVSQGLEQYESVFASLREVVGRKRRRRRRGNRRDTAEPASASASRAQSETVQPDAGPVEKAHESTDESEDDDEESSDGDSGSGQL
jgi:hypothetical protein